MGQDQLDKFIQDKLQNHQSEIDTNALWNSISSKDAQQLDTEIKEKLYEHVTPIDSNKVWKGIQAKKYSFLKYGILSCALLLFGFLLFSLIGSKKTTSSENELSSVTNQSIEKTSQDNVSDLALSKNENLSESSTEKLNSNLADKVVSAELPGSVRSTSINASSDSQSNLDSRDSNNNGASGGNNTFNTTSSSSSESNNFTSPLTDNPDLESKAKRTVSPYINSKDSNRKEFESKNKSELSLLNQIKNINSLSGENIEGKTNKKNLIDRFPEKDECFRDSKSVECYSYRPKKFHLSLLGYGTGDYYLKGMNNSNPDVSSYISERKKSQSYRISNRAGIQLKMMHKSGLYFKTGIEFGVVREKFSYEIRDTTTEILPDQLIGIHIESNGDSTYIYGNAPVTTISQKTWNTNNKFETIGVPLILGYQTQNNKKVNIGGEIGVVYDFSHKFNGHLLGKTNYPTNANDYFNTSNKLNLTGGANVTYKINEKISTFLMASFRQNIKSINDETVNIIDQKNTVFGIGAGFEYRF